jgi:hypothetical protein
VRISIGSIFPTYKVVYRVVRELPKDPVTLAHEGTKAYADTFELIHRREACWNIPKFSVPHDVLLHLPAPKELLTVLIFPFRACTPCKMVATMAA